MNLNSEQDPFFFAVSINKEVIALAKGNYTLATYISLLVRQINYHSKRAESKDPATDWIDMPTLILESHYFNKGRRITMKRKCVELNIFNFQKVDDPTRGTKMQVKANIETMQSLIPHTTNYMLNNHKSTVESSGSVLYLPSQYDA